MLRNVAGTLVAQAMDSKLTIAAEDNTRLQARLRRMDQTTAALAASAAGGGDSDRQQFLAVNAANTEEIHRLEVGTVLAVDVFGGVSF